MNQFRIGAATGLVVFLYAVIGFGLAGLLAKRYPNNRVSQAWLGMYGS